MKFVKRHWIAIASLLAFIAFPFALSFLTGEPIDAGTPKFWQGMLIQVFIWAVFAMRARICLWATRAFYRSGTPCFLAPARM